jgi:DNA-damage-inducible protein D
MPLLGYDDYDRFLLVIHHAVTECCILNISIIENFVHAPRIINNQPQEDYQLSRFACYLIAMNADTAKPQVVQAQSFFAATAEAFKQYDERVKARSRVRNKSPQMQNEKNYLHIENIAYFKNAGYRGMYNTNLNTLKTSKGLRIKRSPLDFMDKKELAANLYRITQMESALSR